MRVFGIDPGSLCTGYGCVETDGRTHRLIDCGAIRSAQRTLLPARLQHIHDELKRLIEINRPDCVAIENLFHAKNVRSALTLGHARGVAVLAAVHAGRPIVEYTPAEIKASVTGYGRADKLQIQHMVKQWLKLDTAPKPHDASDALAVALCHVYSSGSISQLTSAAARVPRNLRSWRHVTIEQLSRRMR